MAHLQDMEKIFNQSTTNELLDSEEVDKIDTVSTVESLRGPREYLSGRPLEIENLKKIKIFFEYYFFLTIKFL